MGIRGIICGFSTTMLKLVYQWNLWVFDRVGCSGKVTRMGIVLYYKEYKSWNAQKASYIVPQKRFFQYCLRSHIFFNKSEFIFYCNRMKCTDNAALSLTGPLTLLLQLKGFHWQLFISVDTSKLLLKHDAWARPASATQVYIAQCVKKLASILGLM